MTKNSYTYLHTYSKFFGFVVILNIHRCNFFVAVAVIITLRSGGVSLYREKQITKPKVFPMDDDKEEQELQDYTFNLCTYVSDVRYTLNSLKQSSRKLVTFGCGGVKLCAKKKNP